MEEGGRGFPTRRARIGVTTAEAFALGTRYHAAGNLAAAEELFRRVLAEDPSHFGATHRLGLVALDAGRLAEAVERLTQAISLNPDSAAAHHNLGLALRRQGLPEQALLSCRRAVALQPGNAAFHANLGGVLAELGRGPEAVAPYDAAVRLDPRQPRWLNTLGVLYTALGRPAEAAVCFQQALRLWHDYPEALTNLTGILADLGRIEEAAACSRRLLALRPDDPAARFLHAAVTGDARPPTAPPALVTGLFDQLAPSFDEHLLQALDYRGPQLLRAAVPDRPGERRLDILDLGCGTGLCGLAFRDLARSLTGVDLSARMLDQARARGVYDHFIPGDLTAVLRAAPGAYDLILAADVFIYVGDLAPVFPAVHAALRPGGRFVFVVEADDGPGYVLRPTRRYAHAPAYVRALAQSCGLTERGRTRAVLRKERDQPVEGDVYVLERAATPVS
jgi:predicted TPR repeat methyltransferase